MFNVMDIEDSIRIPPTKFGIPLEDVAREELKKKYEGAVDNELGYVIAVTEIKISPIGKIIPGDGATYHKVLFSLLTFYPQIKEIVEGEVVEIADFGVFLRVGPVDALIHVSQLMDDFISYWVKKQSEK
jgi:DNA-directed RNA polymerase subunit E'